MMSDESWEEDDTYSIVVDNGGHTMKVGFGGFDEPHVLLPTQAGTPKSTTFLPPPDACDLDARWALPRRLAPLLLTRVRSQRRVLQRIGCYMRPATPSCGESPS